MIAMSQLILFITLQRKILDPDGMLGISLGNAQISKIILELIRVLECGVTNRGLIEKPRSQQVLIGTGHKVLIGTGHNLAIFEVVRAIGVPKIETGPLVVSQEKDGRDVKKWRNVLKSWKML
jgi:hypothetical protein